VHSIEPTARQLANRCSHVLLSCLSQSTTVFPIISPSGREERPLGHRLPNQGDCQCLPTTPPVPFDTGGNFKPDHVQHLADGRWLYLVHSVTMRNLLSGIADTKDGAIRAARNFVKRNQNAIYSPGRCGG
jgi:hypothetical protein